MPGSLLVDGAQDDAADGALPESLSLAGQPLAGTPGGLSGTGSFSPDGAGDDAGDGALTLPSARPGVSVLLSYAYGGSKGALDTPLSAMVLFTDTTTGASPGPAAAEYVPSTSGPGGTLSATVILAAGSGAGDGGFVSWTASIGGAPVLLFSGKVTLKTQAQISGTAYSAGPPLTNIAAGSTFCVAGSDTVISVLVTGSTADGSTPADPSSSAVFLAFATSDTVSQGLTFLAGQWALYPSGLYAQAVLPPSVGSGSYRVYVQFDGEGLLIASDILYVLSGGLISQPLLVSAPVVAAVPGIDDND